MPSLTHRCFGDLRSVELVVRLVDLGLDFPERVAVDRDRSSAEPVGELVVVHGVVESLDVPVLGALRDELVDWRFDPIGTR